MPVIIVAAGSSDNKCRVFSAYVKAVEGRPAVSFILIIISSLIFLS